MYTYIHNYCPQNGHSIRTFGTWDGNGHAGTVGDGVALGIVGVGVSLGGTGVSVGVGSLGGSVGVTVSVGVGLGNSGTSGLHALIPPYCSSQPPPINLPN